jgi:hypothetical protein
MMHRKVIVGVVAAALCVACFGASTASAATLYTNSAHTSAVPVGTTFTASITEPTGPSEFGYKLEPSAPFTGPKCKGGSYSFKVTENSGGNFKASITGGSFTGCTPYSLTVEPTGELKVGGSSIAVGTAKAWLSTTLFTFLGSPVGPYYGLLASASGNPPANGMYAQQPAVGAPVSVVAAHANGLIGGPSSPNWVTGTYVFRGTAASYSFN